MGARKIEVCPNCLDPRLGGDGEKTWCMNTDCAYTWLTFERKESAKERIRRWWWVNVERPLGTFMWRVFFDVVRPFRKWKESAKKRDSDREGWDPTLSEEDIRYIEDLEERGGVW